MQRILVALAIAEVFAPGALAKGPGEPVDFMREIRPLLAQNCLMCHGPDEGTRESGLRLDTRAGATSEADSGLPAVIPGDGENSELLTRLSSQEDDLRMPPPDAGRQLSPDQIAVVRRWIEQGAPYAQHWSFQPPVAATMPPVEDASWPRNEIDHFVLARLDSESLVPSPEASRATLIRRLSLDLTGLLPTPDAVQQFLDDDRPYAYEALVDRLLQSPHFGERWGRHWLDLARYADSDGYLGDDLRPYAWKYRDWVINALNANQPFDQFTIDQLAGDLLPQATLEQQIATGFHRNSMKNTEAGADRELDRVIRTVDRTSTTAAVWLGLTLGCAECHTHKFDPITQDEFYQTYAFFNRLEDHDLPDPSGGTAPTVAETDDERKTFVHVRGDFRNRGAEVQPGTLTVLHPLRPRGSTPDRLDLARWLVDPANPLTPRVTVNHVWKHLFGRGLVATEEDFGATGEAPSHPELLDALAVMFRDAGWDRKRLIRRIVTSAAYRQASDVRPDLLQRDPLNVLLARQSRLRLEAEVVRDAALAASGLLTSRVGGPSIRPEMHTQITDISRNKDWKVSLGADRYRRGMYILFRRGTPYPMLTTFDAPDTTIACTRRERSNSPLQALTLLNDPVFVECSQQLGSRLVREGGQTAEQWITHGFRLCLGRGPTPDELQRAVALVAEQRSMMEHLDHRRLAELVGDPLPGVPLRQQAERVALARVLMNLDEFITRN